MTRAVDLLAWSRTAEVVPSGVRGGDISSGDMSEDTSSEGVSLGDSSMNTSSEDVLLWNFYSENETILVIS